MTCNELSRLTIFFEVDDWKQAEMHRKGDFFEVILFAGFALDELNFGWKSHELETSLITRYKSSKIKLSEFLTASTPDFYLVIGQTPER